ncbi:MAG: hypothetical protein J5I47_00900 [Vicingus serpentipes]|nr:hypothetical protein [Vicingus serpentipes]
MRCLLVTVLSFLLLSPFIKTLFNKVEKPVIIIAQDNSTSILLNKDSAYYKEQYVYDLQQFQENLEQDFEVKRYTFGDEVRELGKLNYTEKLTNISHLFDEVNNKFYNRNVGALIIASDGIFNQGANPTYSSSANFPIYSIALGDTTIPKDIVLKDIQYNKITFLGNQFPIEIYAEAKQLNGEKTRLTIVNNGKQVLVKDYNLTKDEISITENILLDAKEVGVQHYRIALSTVKGEISTINNVRDIYIEVLDGRQRILILGNAPHPDIKALKLSIESNENYEVTTQYFNEFDGNTTPYSLLIIYQIPNDIPNYVNTINEKSISTLYILGGQTAVQKLNTFNTGLSITNSKNKFDFVLPEVITSFPLFTLSEETQKAINSFPPLLIPFGKYQLSNNSYSLLNQKIGNVITEYPLMVFFQNQAKKIAVLSGEGIWKWRMYNYMKNSNHNAFDELINKTVQFLSVKEDKSKFRVITQAIFWENEEVILNAELYNDSYELINEPEIKISLVDEDKKEYDFVFNKTTKAYLLNTGMLPVGFYRYTAKVKLGTKEYVEQGKFQINPILLEANNTIANHQLMQNIATKHDGEMIYPSELKRLAEEIKKNKNITPIIYEENDLKELINLKWIFFLLLFLLSLEWFLRKRNGAY